jgi:hypothetical protein
MVMFGLSMLSAVRMFEIAGTALRLFSFRQRMVQRRRKTTDVPTSRNTNKLITSSSSYHYTNHFGILKICPLPPSFVAAVQPWLKHTPLYLPPAAQQVILGGQWQSKTVVRQSLHCFGGTSQRASVHHHGMNVIL